MAGRIVCLSNASVRAFSTSGTKCHHTSRRIFMCTDSCVYRRQFFEKATEQRAARKIIDCTSNTILKKTNQYCTLWTSTK
jgi:hypothetical protein